MTVVRLDGCTVCERNALRNEIAVLQTIIDSLEREVAMLRGLPPPTAVATAETLPRSRFELLEPYEDEKDKGKQ